MKRRSWYNIFSIIFYVVCIECSNAQNQIATITIDPQKTIGNVKHWIFGNNILAYQKGTWKYASPDYWDRGSGIWDPDLKKSVPEIVSLAKLSGMSVVRYPGGSAARHFDWEKTIGPISKRPDQQFGLPEYLQFCSDIGAVPLITLAEYSGSAQDAANLVEYLNAPNNGKFAWAKRRAEDGHPQPWNIEWFEYGNETYDGDGKRKMNAFEYAHNYSSYRRAMVSIDNRIKLGAVGAGDYPNLNDWLHSVVEIIGKEVDFIIVHPYVPTYTRNDGVPDAKKLFNLSLAFEAQMQQYFDQMNSIILRITGRYIPIALTEYNGLFSQERPVPYRLSLGNALVNAEMIKIFMNLRNNIFMANSWQFSNEYWGAVRGYTYKKEQIIKRPLYYVFELYHNHFGFQLIQADVQCEKYDTDGGYGIEPAKGEGQEYKLFSDTISISSKWNLIGGSGVSQHIEGDTLVVDFKETDVNYYHALMNIDAIQTFGYRVTCWIKTEKITSTNGASIEVIDSRGWDITHSAKSSASITGTSDWQKLIVDYIPLNDTKIIDIRARRISGAGNITGRAYFCNVTVQKYVPRKYPSVPYLSVIASRKITSGSVKKSGNTKVYLMVINKNMDDSISTQINLRGFMPQNAKAWNLTGPSVDATNELDPGNVNIHENDLGKVTNGFVFKFPPHSLTALEIK